MKDKIMTFFVIKDENPLDKMCGFLQNYGHTCPITDLKDNHTTFLRDLSYLKFIKNTKKYVAVIVPFEFKGLKLPDNVRVIYVNDVDYAFTIFHNHIYRRAKPKRNKIGRGCRIHPSVIIGVEGIKFANAPDGRKIQFIHTGDVVIENNVEIGANSIIHRGSMGSTIIKSGVKIGVMINIGHNNIIGENTIVVGGTITSGSVTVGKNCWLCAGTLIRNGVSICDNVIIGMGSMVLKDITDPGIYFGRPAVRMGDYIEDFNM
ncbi:MAG: hypothetical protein PVG65_03885 [Candidatus Thorarchaeota archaeon]|jgi:UDP-3-O-[3-hydroxymyristoyl] glucosamine N-acyltransferase